MCELRLHPDDIQKITSEITVVIRQTIKEIIAGLPRPQSSEPSICKDYYTPEEFAIMVSMDAQSVKKALYEHKIEGQVKVLGRWRIPRQSVHRSLLRGRI